MLEESPIEFDGDILQIQNLSLDTHWNYSIIENYANVRDSYKNEESI